MAEISPLRRRMIEDMTVRNLSPATQQSYLHAVSKFSRHFGHSPDRLGLEEVHAFQLHLVATGVSWPSLNQIVCALRFFYGVTLGQDTVPERIAHAREPSKLPVVLSADEVVRFLEAIPLLAAIIKARWICEQAHQQLKEELGLDHFEGRSWQGLHRHALMTMIAYAFLQHRRLIRAKREKKNQRTTTSAKLASRAPRYRRSHHATASALPELPTMGPGGIAA